MTTHDTPEAVLIDVVAAAINTTQIKPSEITLGHDLRPVARRFLAALPPKWRLVPAEHFDQDDELLAEAVRLHRLVPEDAVSFTRVSVPSQLVDGDEWVFRPLFVMKPGMGYVHVTNPETGALVLGEYDSAGKLVRQQEAVRAER